MYACKYVHTSTYKDIEYAMSEDPGLPRSAPELVCWLNRQFPAPSDSTILGNLHADQFRLELAAQLGERRIINYLITKYRLEEKI